MEKEEIIKRLSQLKEIVKNRGERLKYLNELKRSLYSLKWTKETYTHVKEGINNGLSMINKERNIWEELYDSISEDDDTAEISPEISEFLKKVKCTKDDILREIPDIIKELWSEQDGYLDLQESVNGLIRDLQESFNKLPPYKKIAMYQELYFNPNDKFDLTIMEIKLPVVKEKESPK